MSSLEQLRQLDTSSPTLGFSKGRYQRLEKAVQSKLLERFQEKASESSKSHIHQLNNLKSDDSMRSVIQEVIQKHVEMGDNNNNGKEKINKMSETPENQSKIKTRITNRMIVSRQQQGKRQSLNTLVQEQIKLNCMESENLQNDDDELNFEIVGENQAPIYSAYTQKLLQDTPRTVENNTPRLEINQIFDGRYDKYDNQKYDNSKHDKYDKLKHDKHENHRYDSKKCDDKKYDKYNSNSNSNSNTNLNNTKTIYTTQNYRIIQKSDGSYAYKLPNKPCEEFKSYKNRDAKDIARYVKKLKKRLTTAAAKGSVMSLSKHESDLRLSKKNTPRLKKGNACLDVETIENTVIDTKYMKGKNNSSSKNENPEKNEKTKQNEKNNNSKTDSKTDFKLDSKKDMTEFSKNVSKKTSKNDSKQQLGFKGRNSVAKPSQITQKIKEELSMHSRTNVQLNLLMNKTMKWVMTQDFEGNAKEDAQKLN